MASATSADDDDPLALFASMSAQAGSGSTPASSNEAPAAVAAVEQLAGPSQSSPSSSDFIEQSPLVSLVVSITTDISNPLPCIICDASFAGTDQQPYLLHLLEHHRIVIAKVERVAQLDAYVRHWRQRLRQCVPEQHHADPQRLLDALPLFASVIRATTTTPSASVTDDFYFLLGNVLDEDKALRASLGRARVKAVLAQQERERQSTAFASECLFCRQQCHGNRRDLLDHMHTEHGFSMGHPDNLVFVEDFVALLRRNMRDHRCLFCERLFKSRDVLKSHMRKKRHVRLSSNSIYDRHFLINYLDPGVRWEELRREPDELLIRVRREKSEDELSAEEDEEEEEDEEVEEEEEEDEEEKGAVEEVKGEGKFGEAREDALRCSGRGRASEAEEATRCLFCSHTSVSPSSTFTHMQSAHCFDFWSVSRTLRIGFYGRVKLVNYIRHETLSLRCLHCAHDTPFASANALSAHYTQFPLHCTLDSASDCSFLTQPQYFFPTLDNDPLLCCLAHTHIGPQQTGEEQEDDFSDEECAIPEPLPHIDPIVL